MYDKEHFYKAPLIFTNIRFIRPIMIK